MHDSKRNKIITFRVTDEEYTKLQDAALAQGADPNDWCRHAALSCSMYKLTVNEQVFYTEIGLLRYLIPNGFNMLFEGLIWKDLRATFGTRLAEAGCDAFTIAQLLGHSDVRVTMRYVRSVEETKRVAVEAIKLSSRKSVHKLATNEIQPPVPAAVNG